MPKIEHTSVPPWAAAAAPVAAADASGTSYVLVGTGAAGRERVASWTFELAGHDVRTLGLDELAAGLAVARVGVRVRIAGPTGDCLAARAAAVSAGVEDDELHVAPTGVGPLELHCAHCGSGTPTEAQIGDVVPCAGCGRALLVYHHVSRRTGRFLGFQVDAETDGEEVAS